MFRKERKIIAYYKGYKITATLNRDMTVTYRGQTYDSPSGAGVAAMLDHGREGKARVTVAGWNFWGFEKDGVWQHIGKSIKSRVHKVTKKEAS